MIERRCCGTLEGTPHRSTCRPYMLKEIDRLTAQLDASRALLAERDDVLSARFNENKELYMHWQQALTETTTLRTKLAECEKEMERLKESEEVLTDCLNGSSKAKYTAELYDKGVADARKPGQD